MDNRRIRARHLRIELKLNRGWTRHEGESQIKKKRQMSSVGVVKNHRVKIPQLSTDTLAIFSGERSRPISWHFSLSKRCLTTTLQTFSKIFSIAKRNFRFPQSAIETFSLSTRSVILSKLHGSSMDSVYSRLPYWPRLAFDEIIKPIRNACFAEHTAENPDFPRGEHERHKYASAVRKRWKTEREPLT